MLWRPGSPITNRRKESVQDYPIRLIGGVICWEFSMGRSHKLQRVRHQKTSKTRGRETGGPKPRALVQFFSIQRTAATLTFARHGIRFKPRDPRVFLTLLRFASSHPTSPRAAKFISPIGEGTGLLGEQGPRLRAVLTTTLLFPEHGPPVPPTRQVIADRRRRWRSATSEPLSN
jgi:hypothetical protein